MAHIFYFLTSGSIFYLIWFQYQQMYTAIVTNNVKKTSVIEFLHRAIYMSFHNIQAARFLSRLTETLAKWFIFSDFIVSLWFCFKHVSYKF